MNFSVKKMVYMALLTTVSLSMFVIEQQIPPFVPIPAVKIGLANTITLFVLFLGGKWHWRDAVIILFMRILLSAFIVGQPMSLLFSAVGGFMAFFIMLVSKNVIKGEQIIPIVSIFGAIFHNIGQILVAVLVYGSFSVFYYLPVLFISAIISGFLTGVCVTIIFRKQRKALDKIRNLTI